MSFCETNLCIKTTVAVIALSAALAIPALGQAPPSQSQYVAPGPLPANVKLYLAALGDRVQNPGNGRATLSGTYSDQSGSTPARVIWQAPGSVRVERGNSQGSALAYDASAQTTAGNTSNSTGNSILESLVEDSQEGFLYGFQQGASYRLLATRVRADKGKTANYKGPWYDIYEMAPPAKTRLSKPVHLKHFIIDSQTGLLLKTQYKSASGKVITTEFANWTRVNGQSFPGQITRKENDAVVFSFALQSAVTSPAVNDGMFAAQ